MPPVAVAEAVLALGLAHPFRLAAMAQMDLSFTPTTGVRTRAVVVVGGRPRTTLTEVAAGAVVAGTAVE